MDLTRLKREELAQRVKKHLLAHAAGNTKGLTKAFIKDASELAAIAALADESTEAAAVLVDVLQPYQANLGPEVHGAIARLEELLMDSHGDEGH